jgi:hypothetical protein
MASHSQPYAFGSCLLTPVNHTQNTGPKPVGQKAPALEFPPKQGVQPTRTQAMAPPLCPPTHHRNSLFHFFSLKLADMLESLGTTRRDFYTDPAQPFVTSMFVPVGLQHHDPPRQTCRQTPKLTMSSHPSMRMDSQYAGQASMPAFPPNLTLNLSDMPGKNSFGYQFEIDTRPCCPVPDETYNQQYIADGDCFPGGQHDQSHLCWIPM